MENKNDEREEKKSKTTASKTTASKTTASKTTASKTTKSSEKKVEKGATEKVERSTGKTGSKTKTDETKVEKRARTTKKGEETSEKIASTANNEKGKGEKARNNIKKDETTVETSTQPKIKSKWNNPVLRFIWNLFVKIVTIAIIFISIIIVVQKVTNNAESFLGFRIFRVQTGSMIPKYQIGDVILVKETEPENIEIGDDITYQGETGAVSGILVTHRVIDIEEVDGKRVFHTQGIANYAEDPVVNEDQINGVVQSKMYILSWICTIFNNKYIFYFCGILPLTIYVAFKIFGGKKVKKAERES